MKLAQERGTDALFVTVGGEAIVDWSRDRRPIELMSALKSVVAIAVGSLLQDGKLKSLDEPVHTFFPEWNQGRKKLITVRHLLNHTSGLQNVPNAGVEIYPSRDAIALALAAELTSDPGTEFSYNNKAVNLLAGVIERAACLRMDLYIGQKLFAPLGITDYQWHFDRSGQPHAMAGLRLHAADAAKFGQVVLSRGVFESKRIVTEEFVEEMLAPGQTMHPASGLLWWRYLPEPAQSSAGAGAGSAAAYYAEGSLGQYIVVVPYARLVAVRQIARRPGLGRTTMFHDFVAETVALARALSDRGP